MKKTIIISTLALCIITAGSLTATAFQGYGNGQHHTAANTQSVGHHERGNHVSSSHDMNTKHLNLTEEQQEQIQQIRSEYMAFNYDLREKIRDYQEQMFELSAEDTFDEESIRAIAEDLSNAQVELAVSRARMNGNIQAIMSTEQQEIVEKLRSAGHHDLEQNHHGSDW